MPCVGKRVQHKTRPTGRAQKQIDVEFGVDDPADYLESLSLRYSLADLSGDDIPELLLRKERSAIVADYETETFAHTRVVYYDEKEKVAKLVGPRSKEGVPDEEWANYVIETGTAIHVGKPENEKTIDLDLSLGACTSTDQTFL